MEPTLDLDVEIVHDYARNDSIHNSGNNVPASARVRNWKHRNQPRTARKSIFSAATQISDRDSIIDKSQFAARPPIEPPDELIFPVCVFCGYGRSYEAEFGKFSRMSCDAEIYCHDGCAIEDLMFEERRRERSDQ